MLHEGAESPRGREHPEWGGGQKQEGCGDRDRERGHGHPRCSTSLFTGSGAPWAGSVQAASPHHAGLGPPAVNRV